MVLVQAAHCHEVHSGRATGAPRSRRAPALAPHLRARACCPSPQRPACLRRGASESHHAGSLRRTNGGACPRQPTCLVKRTHGVALRARALHKTRAPALRHPRARRPIPPVRFKRLRGGGTSGRRRNAARALRQPRKTRCRWSRSAEAGFRHFRANRRSPNRSLTGFRKTPAGAAIVRHAPKVRFSARRPRRQRPDVPPPRAAQRGCPHSVPRASEPLKSGRVAKTRGHT